MTRPMTTRELAHARCIAAAKAVPIGFAVALALSMLAAFAAGDYEHYWKFSENLGPSIPIVVTLVAAWTLLLMAGPLLILAGLLLVPAYAIAGIVTWLDVEVGLADSTIVTVASVAVALGAGTILVGQLWIVRRAWQLKLVTNANLGQCLAGWISLSAILAAEFGHQAFVGEAAPMFVPTVVCVPALALAPIAVVPLVFHWYRHRP